MKFTKVRSSTEKDDSGVRGVLILDTDPRGHIILDFAMEEKSDETLAEVHRRLEEKGREILRAAAEAEFPWGRLSRL